MKTKTVGNSKIDEFESLSDFRTFLNTKEENAYFKKHSYLASKAESSSDIEFSGTASYDDANELMEKGSPDGLKKLKETKTKLTERAAQQRPHLQLDVVGFAPCVPNAIIGLPKSMIKRVKTPVKTPVINILYDICLSGSSDKEYLFKGGKNILAAVKTLEAQGYRVNLKIAYISRSEEKRSEYSALSCVFVTIKSASQSLNPLLVSYPLTHPSFFRRHIFRWVETSDITSSSMFDAYGKLYTPYYTVERATEILKRRGILAENEYFMNAYEAANAESLDDLFKTMGLLKK